MLELLRYWSINLGVVMNKINSKLKMFIYAGSGMGVNLLNVVMGTYLVNAIVVNESSSANSSYLNITLVSTVVWSILVTLSKVVDALIDIPVAGITDGLKTRWGRRRPAIFVGMIFLIIFYLLFLLPLQKEAGSLLNTFWFGLILSLFYVSYTLVMESYYSTFSEIVENEDKKLTLSNYKSVFDIIYLIIGYVLIPIFVSNFNIRIVALIMLPISLTMLIPLFMIKEKSTKVIDSEDLEKTEEIKSVSTFESIKLVFKNKTFVIWMLVFFFLQFGLQMFIGGVFKYGEEIMKLTGIKFSLVAGAAFVPVPLTLFIYKKVINKYGFKVGYIYSLVIFMLAMVCMGLCNANLIPNEGARLALGISGGFLSSFGIGAFFSVGYSIPAILAEKEYKKTGISNTAMYFAIQGLASGIAAAISTGLVWQNLRGNNIHYLMPMFILASSVVSFILALFLPHGLKNIGKKKEVEDGKC